MCVVCKLLDWFPVHQIKSLRIRQKSREHIFQKGMQASVQQITNESAHVTQTTLLSLDWWLGSKQIFVETIIKSFRKKPSEKNIQSVVRHFLYDPDYYLARQACAQQNQFLGYNFIKHCPENLKHLFPRAQLLELDFIPLKTKQ